MSDKVKNIKIRNITVDQEIQSRDEALSDSHVSDIAEAIERSRILPPLVVFQNAAGSLLLADGFHRLEAYTRAGWKEVPCIIRKGERAAAIDYAASEDANGGHGLKRTNGTKRKCVLKVLANHADWSDRRIADHVGVTHTFVAKVRPSAPGGEPKTRTGLDGKERRRNPDQLATVASCGVEIPGENDKTSRKPDKEIESRPEVFSLDDEEDNETTQTVVLFPDPKPAVETDGWGIPIQGHAAEAFRAVPRFKELVQAIQHAQRLFNEVAGGVGGEFLTLPEVASIRRGRKGGEPDRFVHEGLEDALRHVKAAIPQYTVCPYQYAEAPHPEGKSCRCCLGLNWVPALSASIPPECISRAKEAFAEGE